MSVRLQSYLHQGQYYFQLACGLVLIIGGILFKIFCVTYDIPDRTFKIILLLGIALAFSMVLLQALLHNRVVMRGITPMAWITAELSNLFEEIHSDKQDFTNHAAMAERLQAVVDKIGSQSLLHCEVEALVLMMQNIFETLQRRSADEAMGKLASQVAHDMRSPLTVLKFLVHHLKELEEETGVDYKLRGPTQMIAKLTQMAEDLLDVSKARRVEKITQNLVSLIKGVVSEVEVIVRDKLNRQITINYVGPDSLRVPIDGHKINRALTNILTNAAQAIESPDGGVISVALIEREDAFTISVRDNGPGIASEKFSELFDRFYTTKGSGGTGLGLAYCREVIGGHGGTIEVESTPGEGSVFTLVLPV